MGVKELIHFLLFIFRRNKHDSKRKSSQGKKTWLLFSRLLNRLLFLIRKSLTVVFALFPWSLEKEWYSENVFIDSAGQRSQLNTGCHWTSNRGNIRFLVIPLFARLYLLVIGPSATLSDVITVLSCSVSISLAWKALRVFRPLPDFLPYLQRKWCTEVPWKIREIEGGKYAGIKIARLLATLFVICTSPVMHFLAPPLPPPPPPKKKRKKERSIVFNFSWEDCNIQERLQ